MIYSLFQTTIAAAGLAFVALLVARLTVVGLSLTQIVASPLTPAIVAATLSAILAAALELVPGLNDWWLKRRKETKRLAWLIGCALLGISPWLLGCIGARLGLQPGFMAFARTCHPDTLAQGLGIAMVAYFAGEATLAATIAARKALEIPPYDVKD